MTRLQSESLREDHDTESFNSGEWELDRWLKASALHAERMRTARTFVWHRGDNVVIGYYSLAANLVSRQHLSSRIGHGSPDLVPAVLLARLALDRDIQGGGLGGQLLLDALARAVGAAESLAVRLVIVDALNDEAAKFYEHFGFARLPSDPFRLVRKMSDIARAFGAR